ncbi:MAG: CoA-binding protein [Flavobacteriaceae bacterium]
MTLKKTLVLGASLKPERYAHQAILKLRAAGHPVLAVGRQAGTIADVQVQTQMDLTWTEIDTVSVYLQKAHQVQYIEAIFQYQPKRVLFNPGTENPFLSKQLQNRGIITENACNLVLLTTDQY